MPLPPLSGALGGATGVISGTMFRSGVAVLGIKQAQIAMSLFASKAVAGVVMAGSQGALEIEREAIQLVSTGALQAVDTGLMRASTKAHMPEEVGFLQWRWKIGVHPGYTAPGTWVDDEGRKRTKPFYVLFVHEGTSTMVKRPYIRQAMINKKERVEQLISAAVVAAARM